MTAHAVRQLPRLRGAAAWNAILGPQPPARPLEVARTADVVVVGGGIAGLAAARRLTQLVPGAAVVLLEAGRLAESTAGRNSGVMVDLPHELTSEDYSGTGDDKATIRLNRHAIGFARAAVEQYQINPGYFAEIGKVNGAAGEAAHAHNLSYAKHLDRLGEAHEALDAQAMRALTGSPHYRSGLYTPGTVLVQPAGYVRGVAAGLSEAVAIHEETPVTGLSRAGAEWLVETPKANVTAPRVILATNGHLESFGFERGRLMHLFLFASMTEELDAEAQARLGGAEHWGVTPSDPMGTTMRRIGPAQGGHRIVTRTCAALRSGMRAREADLARAAAIHRRKFDDRFPQLAGFPMAQSWSGHLCLSMNGVSVMRELEPGLFSASVQNGLGLTRGTLTGIGAAELACGVESDVTRHFTAHAAPSRLVPRPFRDIGANAYLRWKEWRAREE